MLIKLLGHFIDNPQHIDKIIAIKGLPSDWLFRASKYGGKELIVPWKEEPEERIPASIRHMCEEVEITVVYPPIEKGRDSVVDKKKILAVSLDYTSGPGQEMWDKVERYLERSIPRDQKVPKPVLMAPNQKSDFSPHEARRSVRGSLEMRPSEVPFVDLGNPNAGTAPVEEPKSIVVQKLDEPNKEPKVYSCKKCDYKTSELNVYRSHCVRGHKEVKEKVGV